jgi:D-lactate dehydrogenase
MQVALIKKELEQFINITRIIDDEFLLYAYSTDASLYRIIPQLVVIVETNSEVQFIINLANKLKFSITFRAAGTSLSGQALSEEVLVILSPNYWQEYVIYNNGQQIALEPGIIGAQANLLLKPFAMKIGPDPASLASCKIGGIVANNSSGMCCGTKHNTYKTIAGIKIILANGTTLNTNDHKSCDTFKQKNPHIIAELLNIRDQIRENQQLNNFIQNKFSIKSTSGYSLNAFIDFDDPIKILEHLIVGSEGTLSFISQVTYNCVNDNKFKAVSLIFANSLQQIIDLSRTFPQDNFIEAIELLDINSLLALQKIATAEKYLPEISSDTSAILVELGANSSEQLLSKIEVLQNIINQQSILHQIKFTSDSMIYNELWDLRKGIISIIGANRVSNSFFIIEDIAVEINSLANIIFDLRQLLQQFNFNQVAIFGHILAGNIHFILTPVITNTFEQNQFTDFMQQFCHLVVDKYNGSLKAEHGSGRNMAPFLNLEWGDECYALMWRIKKVLDPASIFNPNVKLTNDALLHTKNIKTLYPVAAKVDTCIECGFCESVCPSNGLTLSPRQRITTYRKMMHHSTSQESKKLFVKRFKYYAVDTCATTSLCKTKCPVGIDTGELILSLKQKQNKAYLSVSNFIYINKMKLKLINYLSNFIGRQSIHNATSTLHRIIPIVPVYLPNTPAVQTIDFEDVKIAYTKATKKKRIMYFPSCNNRIFAASDSPNANATPLAQLMAKLGYTVVYPQQLNNLCCGQIFTSKGMPQLAAKKAQEVIKFMQQYDYPVVVDNSSCFYTLAKHQGVNILDEVEFIHQHLEQLDLSKHYSQIALYMDCSSLHLKNEAKVHEIVSKCCAKIVTPINKACCGFAGDKGFNVPELNANSLVRLNDQIINCDIGVTMNRSCQIGLSYHGNKKYIALAELILDCI